MRLSDKTTMVILKYGLIAVLFILFSLAEKVQAQGKKWEMSRSLYKGLDVSFGHKVTSLESNIGELNGLSLIEEGGAAGIIIGNDYSKFVIKPLGLYTATGNTARTINLFALEAENNAYLLRTLLNRPTRFDIYTSVGIGFSSYKFFGHYIQQDLRPAYNNKRDKEPYLGKIENLQINYGLGLEYKLIDDHDFVHFFLTGRSMYLLQSTSNNDAFKNTYFKNNYEIMLGVRFGLIQYNKMLLK